MIIYERVHQLPPIVRSFLFSHEGWIVGSTAQWLLGEKEEDPRDYDVLIPSWEWGKASMSIPPGTPANANGGFKMTLEDGKRLDVWTGDIGWFLAQVPDEYARVSIQPITRSILRLEKGMVPERKMNEQGLSPSRSRSI